MCENVLFELFRFCYKKQTADTPRSTWLVKISPNQEYTVQGRKRFHLPVTFLPRMHITLS